MPDRIVRAGILTSPRACALTWAAEVFYRRLMSVVDDYGRYDGRVLVLRAALYPLQIDIVSNGDIAHWLEETVQAGLVRVYGYEDAAYGKRIPMGDAALRSGEAGHSGKRRVYVQIENFRQRIQGRAKWPGPDDVPHGTGDPPRATVDHGGPPGNTASFGDGVGDGDGDEDAVGNAAGDGALAARGFDPLALKLPGFIPPRSWADWAQHRREIRHRLTPSTARAQIRKLATLHHAGHDVAAVIRHSIEGGYQGLFAPRGAAPARPDAVLRETL